MREDGRVTLVLETGKAHYDPKLGRMVGGEQVEETLPCFISELGDDLKLRLLDKLDVDAKMVRFNRVLSCPIAHVLIGGRKYRVLSRKTFHNRRTCLYVSEVVRDG